MAKPVLSIKKVFHGKLEMAAPFPNISLDALDVIEVGRADAEVVEAEGVKGGAGGGATDVDESGDAIVKAAMGDHAVKDGGERVDNRDRERGRGNRGSSTRVRVRVHRERVGVVRKKAAELGEELGEDGIEQAGIKWGFGVAKRSQQRLEPGEERRVSEGVVRQVVKDIIKPLESERGVIGEEPQGFLKAREERKIGRKRGRKRGREKQRRFKAMYSVKNLENSGSWADSAVDVGGSGGESSARSSSRANGRLERRKTGTDLIEARASAGESGGERLGFVETGAEATAGGEEGVESERVRIHSE